MLQAHPSAYRKALIQLAPVVLAALVILQDAIARGTPLNSAGMYWQAAVAFVGALLVYGPPDVWVKVLFSFVTAIGATVAAALTNNAVTGTEVVQIIVVILVWVGVGAVANTPTETVRPADHALAA